jgi:hypothetical protein
MKRTLFLSVLAATFVISSRGDESTSEDKCRYTLFNPTPAESMRPWRTDRAGVTPYTIDAGHLEVNLTALTYGYDESEQFFAFSQIGPFFRLKVTTEAWAYGAVVTKVGLANSLDAEVGFVPYETITTQPHPVLIGPTGQPIFPRQTVSGFGDVVSRLKFNVWGNDGGKTALSVSGIVKFPTADKGLGNGQFEGGPALEFAAQLPCGFELRIDSVVNLFEDDLKNRQASFNNLLSLSHQIIGNLEGYAMFDTFAFTTDAEWVGSLKAGLNYRIAKNIELYVGNTFGVTDNAFDYQPFIGVAARF